MTKGAQGAPGGGLDGAGGEGPWALLISTPPHHVTGCHPGHRPLPGHVPHGSSDAGHGHEGLSVCECAQGLGWGSWALHSQQRACLVSREPPAAPVSGRHLPVLAMGDQSLVPAGGARGCKGSRLQPSLRRWLWVERGWVLLPRASVSPAVPRPRASGHRPDPTQVQLCVALPPGVCSG